MAFGALRRRSAAVVPLRSLRLVSSRVLLVTVAKRLVIAKVAERMVAVMTAARCFPTVRGAKTTEVASASHGGTSWSATSCGGRQGFSRQRAAIRRRRRRHHAKRVTKDLGERVTKDSVVA